MKIKTYIVLWFSSEGSDPSEVINDLKDIGFVPITGNYDMAFEWNKRPGEEDLLKLADSVKRVLRGKQVLFKLETV